jgi:hypothetical protein
VSEGFEVNYAAVERGKARRRKAEKEWKRQREKEGKKKKAEVVAKRKRKKEKEKARRQLERERRKSGSRNSSDEESSDEDVGSSGDEVGANEKAKAKFVYKGTVLWSYCTVLYLLYCTALILHSYCTHTVLHSYCTPLPVYTDELAPDEKSTKAAFTMLLYKTYLAPAENLQV